MPTKEPIFEVAETGKDLETCTDEEKVFSSKLETLKIAHGEETETYGSYSHGLSYAPGFFVANGIYDADNIWGFVGQYSQPSIYEAPFYCDDTIFYYWVACKFFLFYQDVD